MQPVRQPRQAAAMGSCSYCRAEGAAAILGQPVPAQSTAGKQRQGTAAAAGVPTISEYACDVAGLCYDFPPGTVQWYSTSCISMY